MSRGDVFPLLVNQLLGNNLAIASHTLTNTQKWGMVRKITHFGTRYVKIITKNIHACGAEKLTSTL
jgi:hypothetical protein